MRRTKSNWAYKKPDTTSKQDEDKGIAQGVSVYASPSIEANEWMQDRFKQDHKGSAILSAIAATLLKPRAWVRTSKPGGFIAQRDRRCRWHTCHAAVCSLVTRYGRPS